MLPKGRKPMKDSPLLTEKAGIYRLLSCCFYEPDRELFLKENLCQNLKKLLTAVCPEAASSATQMAEALKNSTQKELTLEHAALFIGPFELLAPPYGSVYLEKGKRLMGDTSLEVKRTYDKAGLELAVQEPADHIAFELEFMQYLFQQLLAAFKEWRNEEAHELVIKKDNFLMEFISPWVPLFCSDIRLNAKNAFYFHLANCLEQFIANEMTRLVPFENEKMEENHAGQTAH